VSFGSSPVRCAGRVLPSPPLPTPHQIMTLSHPAPFTPPPALPALAALLHLSRVPPQRQGRQHPPAPPPCTDTPFAPPPRLPYKNLLHLQHLPPPPPLPKYIHKEALGWGFATPPPAHEARTWSAHPARSTGHLFVAVMLSAGNHAPPHPTPPPHREPSTSVSNTQSLGRLTPDHNPFPTQVPAPQPPRRLVRAGAGSTAAGEEDVGPPAGRNGGGGKDTGVGVSPRMPGMQLQARPTLPTSYTSPSRLLRLPTPSKNV
jgi:hypothetical protein